MSPRKKKKLARVTTPPSNQKQPIQPPQTTNQNPSTQQSNMPPPPPPPSLQTSTTLGISNPLCTEYTSHGYKTPTPIQTQCIPLPLSGRDIIGLAETGSGKTAAFILPILQSLIDKPQRLHSLILAPTRELASQIANVVGDLGGVMAVSCTLLIEGMDMISQAKKPHVIVATPGRLLDHLENTKGFSLRRLKYLLLDEADRLLDCDFGPVLGRILKMLPGRTTCLFSATMSSKVEALQRASLTDPLRVLVSATLLQYYASSRLNGKMCILFIC